MCLFVKCVGSIDSLLSPLSSNVNQTIGGEKMAREAPEVVKKRQKLWKAKDQRNTWAHYLLGGASTGLAAFVSAVELDLTTSKYLTGIVAACAALLTFAQPGARAKERQRCLLQHQHPSQSDQRLRLPLSILCLPQRPARPQGLRDE